MHILILYNAVADDAEAADKDVLSQVAAVHDALRQLGHTCEILGCDLNLAALHRSVLDMEPELVFNLVESLAGTDRLMHLVPALLEGLDIPCTGTGSEALRDTGDKLRAKRRMRDHGIPTAPWLIAGDESSGTTFQPDRYIIKTIHEHASRGLDDGCLVGASQTRELAEHIRRAENRFGRPCFAERFIDGREFNLSLLADRSGVEVLPAAEIEFIDFGIGKPRIVGYRAKWDEASAEYQGTPRRFAFGPSDEPLLSRLGELAEACWSLWALRGYARVDFRVDAEGRPWVLEVNGNPCLSPDAGFAAALRMAGIPFPNAIERIVNDSARGS